jgi:hypothetical protein
MEIITIMESGGGIGPLRTLDTYALNYASKNICSRLANV